jgi:hypothetical protein
MVGAINAPTTGNTLAAFIGLATSPPINLTASTVPPTAPIGGILSNDANSTSSSSSSSSSSASTSVYYNSAYTSVYTSNAIVYTSTATSTYSTSYSSSATTSAGNSTATSPPLAVTGGADVVASKLGVEGVLAMAVMGLAALF